MRTAFLGVAFVVALAVSRDGATAATGVRPAAGVQVAISQPRAASDQPAVAIARPLAPALPESFSESGVLVLVGSALIGLASVVRRATGAA